MRVSPALEDRGCVAAGQTTGGQTQVLIPIITAPTNIKPGAATQRRGKHKSTAIKSIIIFISNRTWTNTTEQLWEKIFVSGVTVNISSEVCIFLIS